MTSFRTLLTLPLVIGALIVLTVGSVVWLGGRLDGQPASLVEPLHSSAPTSAAAAAVVPAPSGSPVAASVPDGTTERLRPVVLADEDKQRILAAFHEAAAKDIERLEMRLQLARDSGVAASEIALMEEKLGKMRDMVRQARLRHPGY